MLIDRNRVSSYFKYLIGNELIPHNTKLNCKLSDYRAFKSNSGYIIFLDCTLNGFPKLITISVDKIISFERECRITNSIRTIFSE